VCDNAASTQVNVILYKQKSEL